MHFVIKEHLYNLLQANKKEESAPNPDFICYKEIYLGDKPVLIRNGMTLETFAEILVASGVRRFDVFPYKSTFKVLSGIRYAIPDVIVTDSILQEADTRINMQSGLVHVKQWEFDYPVEYVSTVTYNDSDPQAHPLVTLQTVLNKTQFLKRFPQCRGMNVNFHFISKSK